MALRFDVFGKEVVVVRVESRWVAYYPGSDGKRRPARDIVVPADVEEAALAKYLDDLCHEWATPRHPRTTRLE